MAASLKEKLTSLLRRGRQPSDDPKVMWEVRIEAKAPHRRSEKR